MPTARRIRSARPDEAPVLTDIAHASKRYWGYEEADIARWSLDLTVTPEFIDAHPVYVAERWGRPCAFYALTIVGEDAEVAHFWVMPDAIGAGVGRALFVHAMAVARDAGAIRLRVVSDPNAIGFYEKMGGRHVGDEPSTPLGRILPVVIVGLQQTTHG